MNSGKVALGVVTGLAAGALLGILFAPASGARTRRRIALQGEHYADAVKEKMDDFIEVVTDKYESIRKEAEAMIAKGKAEFEDVKHEVVNNVPKHV